MNKMCFQISNRNFQVNMESTRLCTECGRQFQSRSGHSRHMRQHKGQAPYRCCGKMFFDKDKLKMHRNHIHGEAAREACFQCGKFFATRQQVTKHMAVVHNANSENFTCDTCGANYTSKQGLQDHTASQHEGRAAHACHCGKEYRHATNLYRHKKSTKH
ncbi:zinc finger protein 2-like [Dreissena polymorpha]|nr:zinc finger protein 2-like [Dreissena polymorpha]